MSTYTKPWKLITFAIGMTWLIWGTYYTPAPDWDIPTCLIMGGATYLFHPWALRAKSVDEFLLSVFLCWICVDGLYAIYWDIQNPLVLQLMRGVQWRLSLVLYIAANLVWIYGDWFISSSSVHLARLLRQRR